MDNNEVIRQNTTNNSNNGNTVAIVSMVLGIVSIVFCWLPLIGLILGIIAIVLSVNGLKNAKIVNKGKGFAIAGLSCGCAGAALNLYYTIVWIFVGAIFKYTFDEVDRVNKNYNYNINNSTSINRNSEINDYKNALKNYYNYDL